MHGELGIQEMIHDRSSQFIPNVVVSEAALRLGFAVPRRDIVAVAG